MNPQAARSHIPDTSGFAHPRRNIAALGIEPGMIVADFGSGSGAYVLEILERMTNLGTVYAIDIQKDLLRRMHNEAEKRGFKNLNVVWGDLEAFQGSKLADGTCDLVLISNLLFQIEEKTQLLSEAKRILQTNGKVVIVDWKESYGGMGPIKGHVVDVHTAKKIALDTGLFFEKEFPAGTHHYGLIFAKKKVHT